MSTRQGVYLYGTDVEIYGSFEDLSGQTITDVTGIKLFVRKPDKTVSEHSLQLVDGMFGIDIYADQVGEWRVRLECATPSRSPAEEKFLVVASSVLPTN